MVVCFDLDGTLVDDTTATNKAVAVLHERLGVGVSASEFRNRWFASSRIHFDRFVAGQITFQEQRRARVREMVRAEMSDAAADDVFGMYVTEYERHWTLFADVFPCLDALAVHRLGVVTNGSSLQQRRKLRSGIAPRAHRGWPKGTHCQGPTRSKRHGLHELRTALERLGSRALAPESEVGGTLAVCRESCVLEYQVRQTPDGAAIDARCSDAVDERALAAGLERELARLGLARPRVVVTRVTEIACTGAGKLKRFVPLADPR
jgi:hypothetical protein